jgi:hypothetical protein
MILYEELELSWVLGSWGEGKDSWDPVDIKDDYS